MSSNNHVVLIGRIGNDVSESLRYVNGAAVAELRLAISRPGKAREGEQSTDWVSCEFWDRQAEALAQYGEKGRLISLNGSLRIDNWEKDGQKRQKAYIRAYQFEFLASAKPKEKVAA